MTGLTERLGPGGIPERAHRAGLDDSGADYSHYAPAYQFGHRFGSQPPYASQSWRQVRDEIRAQWLSTHSRPWEEYAALIRHAWNEARYDLPAPLGAMAQIVQEPAEMNRPVSMEERFYQHFADHYRPQGVSFRQIAPAYHFGYDLAVDARYRNQGWEALKADAEARWVQQNPNLFWQDAVDAITFAWLATRNLPLGRPLHAADFEGFAHAFCEHFTAEHGGRVALYAEYAPAYYLGYDLAVETNDPAATWATLEPEARRRWTEEAQSPAWSAVEEAVHYAWKTVQPYLTAEESEPAQTQPIAPQPVQEEGQHERA